MDADAGRSGTDEITPEQAWQALNDMPGTRLVDVRTEPEWLYVGGPDLGSTAGVLVQISWHVFPAMSVNDEFIAQLERAASPGDLLLFLCRSGGRSLAAARAAAAAGFRRSYSIRGGFEGPVDGTGHRGTVSGWKFAGLPWKQP